MQYLPNCFSCVSTLINSNTISITSLFVTDDVYMPHAKDRYIDVHTKRYSSISIVSSLQETFYSSLVQYQYHNPFKINHGVMSGYYGMCLCSFFTLPEQNKTLFNHYIMRYMRYDTTEIKASSSAICCAVSIKRK